MEDGLSLSLGLKGYEKSPPPPAPLATSLPQIGWIKKPFFVKNADHFFTSSPRVDGSRTQPPPNTALNLGSIGSIPNPDMKIESPKSESSDTTRKRSIERVVIIDDDDDGERGGRAGGGERKKLRLTKEQSAVLEQTFMNQSTLNTNQKVSLAKELNLKPRQVEVWFQNRRARTKLKQTEVDCEYLRRYCERLYDENKRLHKELEELARASKNSPAAESYSNMKPPTTTIALCPACTRTAAASSSSSASPTADGAVGVPYHAATPFRRPSALFPNNGALLKI